MMVEIEGIEYPVGMSTQGVARCLGISYNAAVYLVAGQDQGTRGRKLKAVKDGMVWLVDPESVREYKRNKLADGEFR